MSAPYPPYVSRLGHGEQVVMPPGNVLHARTFVFVLEANATQLDAFVKRSLWGPTGGEYEYRVIGSHVLVTFLDAAKLTSTAETVGYIPDREVAIWVLLAAKKRGWLKPEHFVFWMPYVVVDTSIAMATGREVWGFTKEVGTVSVPADPTSAADFVAQATLFKVFSNETKGTLQPLVRVHKDGALGMLAEEWHLGREAIEAVVRQVAHKDGTLPIYNWASDATLLFDVARLALEQKVPLANLKQFRDAKDPTRACYQALVESGCHFEKFYRGGLLLGDYKVDITPCASHQIVEDLGLAGHKDIPVAVACWVEMDFSVLDGVEVWKAGT